MRGLGQSIYEKGYEDGVEIAIKEVLNPLLSSGKISQSDVEEIIKSVKTEVAPSINKD